MSRELDAKVAELVMGWTNLTSYTAAGETQIQGNPPGIIQPGAYVPKYTTDVAADYQVLVRCRELWLGTQAMLKFHWHLHNKKGWVQYAPGDYSKAALAALGAT